MKTITGGVPDIVDQKIEEYALAHGMLRTSLTGPRPNKALALRSILTEFFKTEKEMPPENAIIDADARQA